MTKVQLRYQLARPLDESLLERIAELHGVYGFLRIEPVPEGLLVEFDASRRAKRVLRGIGIIGSGAEAEGVSRVLNAAAWTYVAALLTSLVYFLWYLAPLLGGGWREYEN